MTARPALRSFLALAGWQGMSGFLLLPSTNTLPDMLAVRPAISPSRERTEVTGAACAAPLTSTKLPASWGFLAEALLVSDKNGRSDYGMS